MTHRKTGKFRQIVQVVCEFYDILPEEVFSCTRKKEIVKARHIIVYLTRDKLKKSYPFIGRRLGNRNHTTVIYSYKKIRKKLEKDQDLKREIETILELIPRNLEIREDKIRHLASLEKRRKRIRPNKKKPLIIKSLNDFPKEELSPEELNRRANILNKYKDGWTLEEIGKEYMLTRERIRQIVERGLVYNAKKIVKQRVWLNLNEFLKEERRKHLAAMKRRHEIPKKTIPSTKKEKRWSRHYDSCRQCGTTIIPHQSFGYCKKCYPKTELFKEAAEASRIRNIENWRKRTKEYLKGYLKRPEVIERRRRRWDLKHFGGNREKVIQRDGYRCRICGITREESFKKLKRDLYVNRIINIQDNRLENLITVCQICHNQKSVKIMREKLRNKKLKKN